MLINSIKMPPKKDVKCYNRTAKSGATYTTCKDKATGDQLRKGKATKTTKTTSAKKTSPPKAKSPSPPKAKSPPKPKPKKDKVKISFPITIRRRKFLLFDDLTMNQKKNMLKEQMERILGDRDEVNEIARKSDFDKKVKDFYAKISSSLKGMLVAEFYDNDLFPANNDTIKWTIYAPKKPPDTPIEKKIEKLLKKSTKLQRVYIKGIKEKFNI